MEQDGIYFHNVEVLERKGMVPGVLLQRFPEQVRLGLGQGDHERGRFFAQVSTGCELRFVTDAYFFSPVPLLLFAGYPCDDLLR